MKKANKKGPLSAVPEELRYRRELAADRGHSHDPEAL